MDLKRLNNPAKRPLSTGLQTTRARSSQNTLQTNRKSESTQSLFGLLDLKSIPKTHRPTTSSSSRLLTSATSRSKIYLYDAPTAPSLSMSGSGELFPGWLTAKKDFQDVKHQYENLACIDCFLVCSKVASQRNDFERQAVVNLMQSCPFFSTMKEYQLVNISERMHSVAFKAGQKLILKGERADCLYLIVKGKVGIYIDSDKPTDEVIEKNVIGEAAIQSRSIRTATVIAHNDVKTLKLTYEDYDIVAFKIKLMDFNLVSSFLQSMEHFSDWSIAKLYRLASVMIVKQYQKGQSLYNIGEPPFDLFVIRQGTVALKVEIEVEKKNRWPLYKGRWQEASTTKRFEKILRNCHEGDFFGEEELMAGVPRKSTAICTSDSCLLFLIRDEFFREIFSERDRKALSTKISIQPSPVQLKKALKTEKAAIITTTEAMLNGLNTNCLPEGREVFAGGVGKKRMGWARRLVDRRKQRLREGLVYKEKSVCEVNWWALGKK